MSCSNVLQSSTTAFDQVSVGHLFDAICGAVVDLAQGRSNSFLPRTPANPAERVPNPTRAFRDRCLMPRFDAISGRVTCACPGLRGRRLLGRATSIAAFCDAGSRPMEAPRRRARPRRFPLVLALDPALICLSHRRRPRPVAPALRRALEERVSRHQAMTAARRAHGAC